MAIRFSDKYRGLSRQISRQAKVRAAKYEPLEERRMLALTTTTLTPAGLKPADLAQELVGPGVAISNVTYVGSSLAAGKYDGGISEGLGTQKGVMLSSGRIANAIGPNTSDGISASFGLPGDVDLDGLIPGFKTNDASVLEFDFIATGDTLSFQYVFASDEYNEFVKSPFNDVFGFFLNGVNVALIPGTTTPVSINNVNKALNAGFYRNNDLSDFPSGTPFLTQADGFTAVLQSAATLKPGLNHIKLAIADAGDTALDSWVFITGNSFVSGKSDLELTLVDDPDPIAAGDTLTYSIVVTNKGPDEATAVVIQDTLPVGVQYLGSSISSGTIFQAGGVVTAEIGNLASGASVTMKITILPTVPGIITDKAVVQGAQFDTDLSNNSAAQDTLVTRFKVAGAKQFEGNSGITNFVVTISQMAGQTDTVSLTYQTTNGTASAGSDYLATTGLITFSPGQTQKVITVQVTGDGQVEDDETFFVRVNDPKDATLNAAFGVNTIINDDTGILVSDLTIIEGDSGTSDAVFLVTLVGAAQQTTQYANFTTANVTAFSPGDYSARGGLLAFAPGTNSLKVTVPVIGDKRNETTETFMLALSNLGSLEAIKPIGVATILDNDLPPVLYVNDAQVTSTSPGVVNAVFTVALDTASGREVTVNYYTAAAGAIDGIDYTGQTGILTFAPGVTTQTISVPVWIGGDYAPNKRFYLNLVDPLFAGIADSQGLATIVHGQAPKPERIIDNGDLGYSTSPGWSTLTNTQAYQLDYDYLAAGNGSGWATWTFPNIAPGTYQVLTRWAPFSNRATNAPFTLLDGGTSLGTVNVNERLAPVGDVTDGIAWQSLGFFTTNTGTLTVRLNNNANGYVVADAIRLVAGGVAVQSPEIDVAGFGLSIPLGDGSPMFEDGTDFGTIDPLDGPIPRTFTIANNGGLPLHLTGTPRVSISGPNASDFSVSIQPAATVGAGQHSTFEIQFDPSEVGLRMAQVTIANDDDSEHPYIFTIQGHGAEPGPSQFIIDDVDAETTGAWSQGSNEDAYQGGSRTLPAGNGNNQMVWEFGGLASGIYDIFATWDAGPSRATNAPFTVTDGLGSTYTLFVNQQLEPRILRDGTLWGSLGMLQVTGGIVRVTLSDNSNGSVEGDAVMVVRRGGPPAAQFAHNTDLPQDVNGDNRVSPADLLMVINNLTAQGAAQQQIASGAFATPQVVSFDTASGPTASPLVAGQSGVTTWLSDVNADGAITPRDALLVINYLLASASARPQASPAAAVDDSQGAAAPLAAAAPEDLSKLVFVATDLALDSLDATTATDWKLDVAAATPAIATSASAALLFGSPAATGEDEMDDAENEPVADDLDLLSDLFAG